MGSAGHLQVALADPEADAEELDVATANLSRELRELDVDGVERPAEPAPEGARSAELAEIGALIVTLATTPAVLSSVLKTVEAWLSSRGRRSARLELDGDVIELSGLSSRDQRRLMDEWIARRGAESG